MRAHLSNAVTLDIRSHQFPSIWLKVTNTPIILQCDLRKPKCLRCEKSKLQCPGFRNIVDASFRDESNRIIRKAHATYEPNVSTQQLPARNPSHPIEDIGAQFFFAKYACDEPPLSKEYCSWLLKTYYEDSLDYPFRAAIEAVGMGALSNIYYAPDVAAQSKQKYCRALKATQLALNDPIQSVTDATLVAVLSLGMYEV